MSRVAVSTYLFPFHVTKQSFTNEEKNIINVDDDGTKIISHLQIVNVVILINIK